MVECNETMVSTKLLRLFQEVDPPVQKALLAMLEEIEQQQREVVRREDVEAVWKVLRKVSQNLEALTEAQRRTGERVEALAEAQRKTEEQVKALVEAQRKAEERLDRLEETVQKLIEAQRKTERQIQQLVGEQKKIRQEIGGFKQTFGYFLEDRAYRGLPTLLKRDYGIEVEGTLKRTFIRYQHRHIEVNIIGRGRRNGTEIWIVGEAKTQLWKRDVGKFLRQLDKLREVLDGELFPVVVTYQAVPEVAEYVNSRGLALYYSYEFPM